MIKFGQLLVLFLPSLLFAEVAEIDYSFRLDKEGGVASLRVDAESGKILEQKVVYQSKHCTAPKKVRPTANPNIVLLTNDSEDEPYLFVVDKTNSRLSRIVELPTTVDEARIARNQALLTCDKDQLVSVDINSRTIMGIWDVGKILKPKGNGPQDVLITKDGRYAIFSFQKDNSTGKKKGGRLALFELPGMILKSDILLARDYRDWDIEEKIRRQGPGLELIFLDEQSNTLISTSDHYGALAVMNWSDVLAGELTTLQYIPTSARGDWGHAFPDRGVMFRNRKRTYCLITNAGVTGGALLFDVATRRVTQFFDTPPGIETPVYFPELSKAFAVCPGKTKKRVVDKVLKTYFPQRQMFVFDFSKSDETVLMKTVNYDDFLFQIGVLPRSDRAPLLAVSIGATEKQAERIMIVDTATQKTLDQKTAIGTVVQFAHP